MFGSPWNLPLVLAVVVVPEIHGDTIIVDVNGFGDYEVIQDAVDAASDGDEVIVLPGTYHAGDPSANAVVDLHGKQILLASFIGAETCIIDGELSKNGIICADGEDDAEILAFTIRNCATIGNGAGMRCVGAGPTVVNCIFENNYAIGDGGGLHVTDASMTIRNCTFNQNAAVVGGGVMAVDSARKTLMSLTLEECTFTSNSATVRGAQLDVSSLDSLVIRKTTFFSDDTADSVVVSGTSDTSIVASTVDITCLAPCEQQQAALALTGGSTVIQDSSFPETGYGSAIKVTDGLLSMENVVVAYDEGECHDLAAVVGHTSVIQATQCSWINSRRGSNIKMTGSSLLEVMACNFEGLDPLFPIGQGIIADEDTSVSIAESTFQRLEHGVICHDHGGLIIRDTMFTGNITEEGYSIPGAGFHLTVTGNGAGDSTLLKDCTFTEGRFYGNFGISGDGVVLTEIGDLEVTGCDVTRNWGTGRSGAGYAPFGSALFITDDGLLDTEIRIDGCEFRSNGGGKQGVFGGQASALRVPSGPTTISNCIFASNKGEHCGAFWADADFRNCRFSSNNASLGGVGTGYVRGSMIDCTIVSSNSDCGYGALQVGPGTTLERVTIYQGRAGNEWESFLDCCVWDDNQLGGCIQIGDGSNSQDNQCGSSVTEGVTIKDSMICNGTPTEIHGPYTDLGGNYIRPTVCAGDLTHDGVVSGADLASLLGSWGQPCLGCQVDLDFNGVVDGADLSILLGSWGLCP